MHTPHATKPPENNVLQTVTNVLQPLKQTKQTTQAKQHFLLLTFFWMIFIFRGIPYGFVMDLMIYTARKRNKFC